MKRLFLLLALVGMFTVGCTEGGVDDNIDNGGNNTEQPGEDDDDENKEDETIFITDSKGNVVVEAEGGEVVVTVTTDIEYSVEIPEEAQSWLSVADTRAIRMEKLTFTVADNDTFEERSANVNLCAKGGDILQTITIKQNKSNAISCANNEVIYTTKYGYPIELNITEGFGGDLMSHTYEDGYGRISFDNDVVSIPNEAFKDCTTLTTIVLPNSLSTIDSSAFENCTSLTSVTIPDSVTSIGYKAFRNCTGELIVNCNIPSVSSYDYSVFYDSDFTKVTIGDSVTSIGDCAFFGCNSLTSVTIGDSVTSIGSCAFYCCASLKSVTIGNSVTSIGYSAFWGCTSLTSVYITDIAAWCNISFSTSVSNPLYYAENLYLNNELVTDLIIPDSVTSIGSCAFYCCASLKSVTIPDSVTSIGSGAFCYCTSLTSITIPDSVTSIGGGAFHDCDSLTSVTIPDSVTSIGDNAFYDCDSLASVTIGNGVTSIGSYAFSDCKSLKEVYCKPTTPPTGGSQMFDYNASGRTIYVFPNSVSKYKSASKWSDYASDIVGSYF